AFQLRFDAGFVHRLEEHLDVRKGVGEDDVEVELLFVRRVFGVVHGAHIQGADFGLELGDVPDALGGGDADGTGGKVDDDRASLPDAVTDLPVDLHPVAGAAVVFAGVDVHDAGAGVVGPVGVF